MTVSKHLVLPHMVRRIPAQFSWIDHRLVRERYIDSLSHGAAALYLFLVTVSDAQGLSYYGDESLAKRLGMDKRTLGDARSNLIESQLIAYQKPLYQVLGLDSRREQVQISSGLSSLGEILARIAGGEHDRL